MNQQELNHQDLMLKRLNLERQMNKGPWTKEEHSLFLRGIDKFTPKSWKQIAELVQTRDQIQVRSHAQKYFNRQIYEMSKIENQVLPERFMNTSEKTRSRVSLDELDSEIQMQQDNPSPMQIQGQMNQSMKEIKTKRIIKSSKWDKEGKRHSREEQDKFEDRLTKNTIINNTLAKQEVLQLNEENNYEITRANHIFDKKRTPSKRKSTSINKKSQKQNDIYLLQTGERSIYYRENITSSNKWQQSNTKDNIILSMSPCSDYFKYHDLDENSPETPNFNTICEDFRISHYSAFKPVINSLQIE